MPCYITEKQEEEINKNGRFRSVATNFREAEMGERKTKGGRDAETKGQ